LPISQKSFEAIWLVGLGRELGVAPLYLTTIMASLFATEPIRMVRIAECLPARGILDVLARQYGLI
jgi:hypothetical protein